LLVTGLSLNKIKDLLSPLGKTSLVGESFGIIKFQDPELGEIDIAIPRKERLMTDEERIVFNLKSGELLNSHQSFIIDSDPNLPIEIDLERRDFTINSIAMDLNGNFIDPFNGIKDIENKLIRMTNEKSFEEDPLRMLRAVQFQARFNFNIEEKTLETIQKNASKIKSISKERVLTELDKIFQKGNIKLGIKSLKISGLWSQIFDFDYPIPNKIISDWDSISYRAEFYALILQHCENADEF